MKVPSIEYRSTDVLIIGGGVAGLMAAYQIMLGKDKRVSVLSLGHGSSVGISGFNVPFSDGDSIDLFIQDTIVSGHGQGNTELVTMLAEGALPIVDYLESLGFEFDRNADGQFKSRRPIGASFPRVIGAGNHSGKLIMDILEKKLLESDSVDIFRNSRALRILSDNDQVQGVLSFDIEKKAFICWKTNLVLLAAGGYSRLFDFSTNPGDISGNGAAMAYYAGAAMTDMEFVQFEPCVAVYPQKLYGHGIFTTMMHEGACLVNSKGERFMNQYGESAERVNKDVLANAVFKEIKEGRGSAHGGVLFDLRPIGKERFLEYYNSFYKLYLSAGVDPCKDMLEVAPAALTSLGGVEIDKNCRSSLNGLYACGESAGNCHGANRIGGSAGLEALVFGKLAGENIRKLHLSETQDKTESLCSDVFSELQRDGRALSFEEFDEMKHRLGVILSTSFNLAREESEMTAASDEIHEMLKTAKFSGWDDDPLKICERIKIINDITTAWLLTLCAIERRETRGCHVRTDYPDEAEKAFKSRIVRKNGKPVITHIPLK